MSDSRQCRRSVDNFIENIEVRLSQKQTIGIINEPFVTSGPSWVLSPSMVCNMFLSSEEVSCLKFISTQKAKGYKTSYPVFRVKYGMGNLQKVK